MTRTIITAAALCAASGAAYAGGVDRSGQSLSALFEQGNYAELSFGTVTPSVSGNLLGLPSGNMTNPYWQVGAAYKQQINDNLSYAVIFDQPFGADVQYSANVPYPLATSSATLETAAVTGVLRYRMDNGFGVHGGLRVQRLEARANFPIVAGYNAVADADYGVGYLAGASYERPDIALRVSLTYNSKVKTSHTTLENLTAPVTALVTKTEVETPQSVNLDFQTGIAKDTLVFGGVRWVEWSEFTIDPLIYRGATGNAFLSYNDDTVTYTMGVGRRFTDTWSGSLSMTYEDGDSVTPVSNLGPTSGKFGVTVGARYKNENFSVSTGVNYTWIGDATTAIGPLRPQFTDNSAIGVGVKVGWNY
ncbi:MAG: OmpP1/FadL family transporter [Roseovarius sp.]|nr:outer membrane protein transport protein [Roseovarius sp.]